MATTDERVLKVSSTSAPNSLAAAIAHAIYEDRTVVLRAIGASAVNQAVKAIAIARGFTGQRGLNLSMRPGFENVQMADGTVSAIVMRVSAD